MLELGNGLFSSKECIQSSHVCRVFFIEIPLASPLHFFPLIECFHSRGQHLCKFIETKESVCIRKEFNSQRISWGHQHGRRFFVLGHQYGRRDVMWKHSIGQFSALKNTSFEEIRTQTLFGKELENWEEEDYMVTYMNQNTDDVHNKSSTVLSSKLVFRIVCCFFLFGCTGCEICFCLATSIFFAYVWR